MTLGPLGPTSQVRSDAGACAQCGRRIGAHLAYEDPAAPRHAGLSGARICYRCFRLATRGHAPPSIADLPERPGRSPARFLLYRLGAVFVACATFFAVSRTRELVPFLYGLGGVMLFLALSAAARPPRAARSAGEGAVSPRPGPPASPDPGNDAEPHSPFRVDGPKRR